MKYRANQEHQIRILEASDERQYMINERYEVYEKQGAPTGAMAFHYHNFYEILYVLEGEYSSMLENRTYHLRKGDFLLINRNVMHKYHYIEKKHDSSKRIILWITEQMLEQLAAGDMELTTCFENNRSCACHFPVYYEELLRGYLLQLARRESEEESRSGSKKVLDRGYLTLFFGYLNILCCRTEYLFEAHEVIRHPLVEEVNDFIAGHMKERITVELLAEQVHMSKFHFLRKFKELTGVTVHSFLTDKRLIRACEELKQGSSVTQAYQEAGFPDYSSFLRNFKAAYGVSPGKYIEYYRSL